MANGPANGTKRFRAIYLLLLIPFIATLWVPFYSGNDPALGGIPYFYWYMFLWIIISSVLTGIVYVLDR